MPEATTGIGVVRMIQLHHLYNGTLATSRLSEIGNAHPARTESRNDPKPSAQVRISRHQGSALCLHRSPYPPKWSESRSACCYPTRSAVGFTRG